MGIVLSSQGALTGLPHQSLFMPKVLHTISEAADRNFGVLCEVVTEGWASTGDPVQFIQD